MPGGSAGLVKTKFDFGWRRWTQVPEVARLALSHQKGDVLDIGCATCQLYAFLRENGWKGRYVGVDVSRYEGYEYPPDVVLIIGDALEVEFPAVDTVVMYDVLEHVDDPVRLLGKGLAAARRNVLVSVPLRNEEMWKLGVVEPHQIDRTHRHSGFSEEEFARVVSLSGGKVVESLKLGRADATIGVKLWESPLARKLTYLMGKVFRSKVFYCGPWCEVVRA